MTTTIDFAMIIQMILAIGFSIIGFFLKGIYSEIKQLATDVRKLSELAASHEAHRQQTETRLTRLESKIDNLL